MAGTPNSKRKKFTKKTEETIKKLEEAFALDASVEEACFYANISKPTYYSWIKQEPKLEERFNDLRQKPILLARQTVIQKMTDSYSNSMDYLSRKKKAEFSTRSEVDVNAKLNVDVSIDEGMSTDMTNILKARYEQETKDNNRTTESDKHE